MIVLEQLQHTAPKRFVGVVPYCIPFPRVPSVSIVLHTGPKPYSVEPTSSASVLVTRVRVTCLQVLVATRAADDPQEWENVGVASCDDNEDD